MSAEVPPKREKLSSAADDTQSQVPSNSLSPIFRLNAKCFKELFEYIPVEDLHSISQTCKLLRKIGGEYFKENYSSANNLCYNDGIYTVCTRSDKFVEEHRIHIPGFYEFMCKITDSHGKREANQYFQSQAHEFKSLNHIEFAFQYTTKTKIEFFKEILPKIQYAQFRDCNIDKDFYDFFWKFCPDIKKIYLQNIDIDPLNNKIEWMKHIYPKLEHVEITPLYPFRVNELNEFFILNSHIQSFTTSFQCIWENHGQFLNTDIKFDLLELKEDGADPWEYMEDDEVDYDDEDEDDLNDDTSDARNIWRLLNKFYENGLYKRLHFYINSVDDVKCNKIVALHALEALCIKYFHKSYSLVKLTDLKELSILNGTDPVEMYILANSLIKLERVFLQNATYHDIIPFICKSEKLKEFKIHPKSDEHFNGGIIDLFDLNDARAQLNNAEKTTIFVPINIFLKTKWTSENGITNFEFIELKKIDSHNDNFYFN